MDVVCRFVFDVMLCPLGKPRSPPCWDIITENQISPNSEREYMYFGHFLDIKSISQEFLDLGLHNDENTKNQPIENCGLRAYI